MIYMKHLYLFIFSTTTRILRVQDIYR